MEENQIQCPKCKSTQLSANKKGWTMTTGLIGSNKVLITCLKCGKQFKPGDDLVAHQRKQQQQAQTMQSPVFWIIFIIFICLFIWMIKGCGGSSTSTYTPQSADSAKAVDAPSNEKPTVQEPKVKYEIVNRETDKTGATNLVYVYIKSTKSISELNDYLIEVYQNRSTMGFQIYYFNNRKIAKTYYSEVMNTGNSDDYIDQLSKHIIARYEYNSTDGGKLEFGKEAQQ